MATNDDGIDELFDNDTAEESDPRELRLARQRDAEVRARVAAEEQAKEEERLRAKAKLERDGIKFAIVATLIVVGLAITFVALALHQREKSHAVEPAGKKETHHGN